MALPEDELHRSSMLNRRILLQPIGSQEALLHSEWSDPGSMMEGMALEFAKASAGGLLVDDMGCAFLPLDIVIRSIPGESREVKLSSSWMPVHAIKIQPEALSKQWFKRHIIPLFRPNGVLTLTVMKRPVLSHHPPQIFKNVTKTFVNDASGRKIPCETQVINLKLIDRKVYRCCQCDQEALAHMVEIFDVNTSCMNPKCPGLEELKEFEIQPISTIKTRVPLSQVHKHPIGNQEVQSNSYAHNTIDFDSDAGTIIQDSANNRIKPGDSVTLIVDLTDPKSGNSIAMPVAASVLSLYNLEVELKVRWKLCCIYHRCSWIDVEMSGDAGHDTIIEQLQVFTSTVSAQVERLLHLRANQELSKTDSRQSPTRISSLYGSHKEENQGEVSMVQQLIRRSTRSLFADRDENEKDPNNTDGNSQENDLEESSFQSHSNWQIILSNRIKEVLNSTFIYLGSCFRLLVCLSVIPDPALHMTQVKRLHTLQQMKVVVDELTMLSNRGQFRQNAQILDRIRNLLKLLLERVSGSLRRSEISRNSNGNGIFTNAAGVSKSSEYWLKNNFQIVVNLREWRLNDDHFRNFIEGDPDEGGGDSLRDLFLKHVSVANVSKNPSSSVGIVFSQLLIDPENYIRVLDLSGTFVGDVAAIEIASAIKNRRFCHLEYLDISSCRISNEGAQALAAALSVNDQPGLRQADTKNVDFRGRLRYLFLHRNVGLSESGGLALIRGLSNNLSILLLEVAGTRIPKSQAHKIRDLVQHNQLFHMKYSHRDVASLPELLVKAACKGSYDVCESIFAEANHFAHVDSKKKINNGEYSISNEVLTTQVLTKALKATYEGQFWDTTRKDCTRQLLLPGAEVDQLMLLQKNHAMSLYVKKWLGIRDSALQDSQPFLNSTLLASDAQTSSMVAFDPGLSRKEKNKMVSMPGKFWVELPDFSAIHVEWMTLIYLIGVMKCRSLGFTNWEEKYARPGAIIFHSTGGNASRYIDDADMSMLSQAFHGFTVPRTNLMFSKNDIITISQDLPRDIPQIELRGKVNIDSIVLKKFLKIEEEGILNILWAAKGPMLKHIDLERSNLGKHTYGHARLALIVGNLYSDNLSGPISLNLKDLNLQLPSTTSREDLSFNYRPKSQRSSHSSLERERNILSSMAREWEEWTGMWFDATTGRPLVAISTSENSHLESIHLRKLKSTDGYTLYEKTHHARSVPQNDMKDDNDDPQKCVPLSKLQTHRFSNLFKIPNSESLRIEKACRPGDNPLVFLREVTITWISYQGNSAPKVLEGRIKTIATISPGDKLKFKWRETLSNAMVWSPHAEADGVAEILLVNIDREDSVNCTDKSLSIKWQSGHGQHVHSRNAITMLTRRGSFSISKGFWASLLRGFGTSSNHAGLTCLNLSSNNIDELSLNFIAHLVSESKTITALDLSSNWQTKPGGLLAIVKAAHDHPTLTALNVNKTNAGEFTPGVASSISSLLRSPNCILEKLNIKGNRFSSSDLCMILKHGVAINTSLKKLFFGANDFSCGATDVLRKNLSPLESKIKHERVQSLEANLAGAMNEVFTQNRTLENWSVENEQEDYYRRIHGRHSIKSERNLLSSSHSANSFDEVLDDEVTSQDTSQRFSMHKSLSKAMLQSLSLSFSHQISSRCMNLLILDLSDINMSADYKQVSIISGNLNDSLFNKRCTLKCEHSQLDGREMWWASFRNQVLQDDLSFATHGLENLHSQNGLPNPGDIVILQNSSTDGCETILPLLISPSFMTSVSCPEILSRHRHGDPCVEHTMNEDGALLPSAFQLPSITENITFNVSSLLQRMDPLAPIASFLRNCSTIQSLNLSGCSLSHNQISTILNALTCKHYDVSGSPIPCNESLTCLNISKNDFVNRRPLSISTCLKMVKVTIECNQVSIIGGHNFDWWDSNAKAANNSMRRHTLKLLQEVACYHHRLKEIKYDLFSATDSVFTVNGSLISKHLNINKSIHLLEKRAQSFRSYLLRNVNRLRNIFWDAAAADGDNEMSHNNLENAIAKTLIIAQHHGAIDISESYHAGSQHLKYICNALLHMDSKVFATISEEWFEERFRAFPIYLNLRDEKGNTLLHYFAMKWSNAHVIFESVSNANNLIPSVEQRAKRQILERVYQNHNNTNSKAHSQSTLNDSHHIAKGTIMDPGVSLLVSLLRGQRKYSELYVHIKLIDLLASSKVDVNLKNKMGQTALFLALRNRPTLPQSSTRSDRETFAGKKLRSAESKTSHVSVNAYIGEALVIVRNADISRVSEFDTNELLRLMQHKCFLMHSKSLIEHSLISAIRVNTGHKKLNDHLRFILSCDEHSLDINWSDVVEFTRWKRRMMQHGEDKRSQLVGIGGYDPVESRFSSLYDVKTWGSVDDAEGLYVPVGDGKTALHWATESGNVDVVDALLNKYSQSIDVDVADSLGRRPLHYCAMQCQGKRNFLKISKTLIKANASLVATTTTGDSPLHYAARSGNLDIARIISKLLFEEAPQKLDSANTHKQTALHIAVKQLNPEMIMCLLENGAGARIRDAFGLTPFSYCLQAVSRIFPGKAIFGRDFAHKYDSVIKVEHCSLGLVENIIQSNDASTSQTIYEVKIIEGPATENTDVFESFIGKKKNAMQKWRDKVNVSSFGSSLFKAGSNIQVTGDVLKLGPISDEEQVSRNIRRCCICLATGGESFGENDFGNDSTDTSSESIGTKSQTARFQVGDRVWVQTEGLLLHRLGCLLASEELIGSISDKSSLHLTQALVVEALDNTVADLQKQYCKNFNCCSSDCANSLLSHPRFKRFQKKLTTETKIIRGSEVSVRSNLSHTNISKDVDFSFKSYNPREKTRATDEIFSCKDDSHVLSKNKREINQSSDMYLSPRFETDNVEWSKAYECLNVFVSSSTELLSNRSSTDSVVSYVAHTTMGLLTMMGICSPERRKVLSPELKMIMEEARPHELDTLDNKMFYQLYVRPRLYDHLESLGDAESVSSESEEFALKSSKSLRKKRRNFSRIVLINELEHELGMNKELQNDVLSTRSSGHDSTTRPTTQIKYSDTSMSSKGDEDADDYYISKTDIKIEKDYALRKRQRRTLVKSSSDSNLIDTMFSDEAVQANIQTVWKMEVAPQRWLSLITWLLTTLVLLIFCLQNYRTHYSLTNLEGSFIAGLHDAFVDENEFSGQPGFREIGDYSGWFDWLEKAAFSNLYADEVPQSSQASEVLRYSSLIGVPRIINIQVPNQTCPGYVSSPNAANNDCVAPILETMLYGFEQASNTIQYSNLQNINGTLNTVLLNDAWQYREKSDLDSVLIHSIPLPYNNGTQAMKLVGFMKADPHFYNKNTAALGLQFHIYNPNLNVISTVSLISYMDPSGYVQSHVRMPLFLANYTGGWQLVLMLALILLFAWRMLSEINECVKSRPIVKIGDRNVSSVDFENYSFNARLQATDVIFYLHIYLSIYSHTIADEGPPVLFAPDSIPYKVVESMGYNNFDSFSCSYHDALNNNARAVLWIYKKVDSNN